MNVFFLVVLGFADALIFVALRALWDLLDEERTGFIFLFIAVVLGLIGVLGYLEWIWFLGTFKQ